MPRALVTGGAGFVGWNLARLLADRDWQTQCLVRSSSSTTLLEKLDVQLVRGSLDDAESLSSAVQGADVVFHLAGRTAALREEEYRRDNVEGTRNVAAACAEQQTPPTLVFVSSLAAGGPGAPTRPRREADPPQPVSAYGRSKLAAESAARAFATEVPISIVRPPMVFGDADHATLSLYRGMQWLPLHLVSGWRGFPLSLVHAVDLSDALIRVAMQGERATAPCTVDVAANGVVGSATSDSLHGQGIYHVATDRWITYAELGRLAAESAGWVVATAPLPPPAFWVLGAIGEAVGRLRGRPALVNLDKIREARAGGWVCNDEKIRTSLGYSSAATLEQRFAETTAWYRDNGWLR